MQHNNNNINPIVWLHMITFLESIRSYATTYGPELGRNSWSELCTESFHCNMAYRVFVWSDSSLIQLPEHLFVDAEWIDRFLCMFVLSL